MRARIVPIALAAVLLALSLSGCVDESQVPADEKPDESSPDAAPAELSTGIELTGCDGFGATSDHAPGEEPGTAPSDWEIEGAYVGSSTFYEGFVCQRISVGPFERGPIHILLESFNAFTPPEACMDEPGPFRAIVLQRLWVNDTDIAEYLGNYADMPTGIMQVTLSSDTTLPNEAHHWTWTVNDSRSELTVYHREPTQRSLHDDWRYLWHNGSAAAELRMSYDLIRPMVATIEGIGDWNEPFLVASDEPYAATAQRLQGDLSGSFKIYTDTLCSEEAWP